MNRCDGEWVGPSLAAVLEAPELPRGVQIGRLHVHERVLAPGVEVVETRGPFGVSEDFDVIREMPRPE